MESNWSLNNWSVQLIGHPITYGQGSPHRFLCGYAPGYGIVTNQGHYTATHKFVYVMQQPLISGPHWIVRDVLALPPGLPFPYGYVLQYPPLE